MDNIKLEELAKVNRNAYMKSWRKKNPDKIKKQNANYWKNRVLKELEKEGENTDTEKRDPRLA